MSSTSSLPKTFKAVVIKQKGAPLELQDLPLKSPGTGEVLVKVLACGVCHTDAFEQGGFLPNDWPIVPGHEIVGDVVAVGEGVTRFKAGDRVGGPWHGGHDGTCRSCQRGVFQMCDNSKVNGVSFNGGYAEYTMLRSEAVVRVPADLVPAETAPLLCAGVTVFNGIRKMHVEQGNLVAVQGLGGLGHLAVQYSRAMGYRTVAVSSGGDEKRDFAMKLGANEFIDSGKEDVAKRLNEMGGAALIVSTAPSAKAVNQIHYGLGSGGKLLTLAPVGPVEFDTGFLVTKGASVHGWPSGHALDSEECIEFSRINGVKCYVEKFPLEDAPKAFEAMLAGKLRFRGVLTMG